MNIDFLFLLNSAAFGVGLAMDAFSVSMANGLSEPKMKPSRMCLIAGVFALFQIAMPLFGWFLAHTAASAFASFQSLIPWIALILLLCIGGKMLIDGIRNRDGGTEQAAIGFGALLIQGVATSIDALSVGLTIAEYHFAEALIESAIIGIVTFVICISGVLIGKKFGMKLSRKASILGGVILIAIGIEIFISGIT